MEDEVAQEMRVGWLWFDNDPGRTVEEKVRRAATRYQARFGQAPNTCYVHPQAIAGEEQQCGAVRVVAARHVLLHHFWLGVERAGNDDDGQGNQGTATH
jgi:hypothetical protein